MVNKKTREDPKPVLYKPKIDIFISINKLIFFYHLAYIS